jgi:hypothetical protein
MYAANITLEIVTLDTHNNVTVFVTDAPDTCAPMIDLSFKIRQVSHFAVISHRLSLSTIIIDMSATECKQVEEHSVLPTEVLSV